MPLQVPQHGSGRVCGKKLPCSHRCSERAGSNHVCVCNRKWTLDPGCGHKVTGMCSDYSKIGLPCLELCGKALDCGHPCLEPCNSNSCICQLCLDKYPGVTSDSDSVCKSETERFSATTVLDPIFIKNNAEILKGKQDPIKNSAFPPAQPEMGAYKTLRLVIPKISSTQKYRNGRFASTQFPTKKVTVIQQPVRNENGLHGLQNGIDNNKPCSSKMAYGNTNGSAIPPPKQSPPGTPVHGINNGLYMGMTDDNAWKLGYAKCVNAHYFRADRRKCDTCGKKSEYQLPDGYYSDSDSD